MKTFLFLLCYWFASQGSRALEWNQSVKKSGSTIYACSNDIVIFPYLFNLSKSESIVSMTWTYHKNDAMKMIGNLLINEFMTARNYYDKVIYRNNGNFTMLNVNAKDTGKYILKIQTQNKDQSKQTYNKEMSLVVTNNVMYKGNNLISRLSDKADWNSDTESFSLSLTCGDFIFKNDNAPIDVEWITPDGSVKNSTKYSDGKFYLQLDNPVKGGQYVCKINEASVSTVCATLNDNTQVTVSVNEDKARIILLENDNRKFKENFEQVNENFEQVKEKIESGDQKLKEQFEEIKDQYRKLKDHEKKLELLSHTAKSCEDWSSFGSGKRNISLITSPSIEIYCDQDIDGGRWNVFQRRRDGSVDFYRGWSDYRNGFGDLDNEFWLGLETVHQMTNNGQKYELRFDLEKQDGSKYYAVYDDFSIGSESEGYAIHFIGYKGNAGDSFTWHKGMKFSTKDRDQDIWDNANSCANDRMGAWWYKNCGYSNLNGHYNDKRSAKGVIWEQLTGWYDSLKKTEMKFRLKK